MKIQRRSISTIEIGQMRDIVQLMPPTDTPNGRGGINRQYLDYDMVQVYGLVHPGGNERSLQEANLTFDNIITVYIRWQENLDSSWKIRYDGYDYTIHKASNIDARKRFIEILCYTKQP